MLVFDYNSSVGTLFITGDNVILRGYSVIFVNCGEYFFQNLKYTFDF